MGGSARCKLTERNAEIGDEAPAEHLRRESCQLLPVVRCLAVSWSFSRSGGAAEIGGHWAGCALGVRTYASDGLDGHVIGGCWGCVVRGEGSRAGCRGGVRGLTTCELKLPGMT